MAAALASPAIAEPLTFDDAVARALASTPSIRAANLQVEAARSASRAAGVLPDPRLKFGLENLPVSGPDAGRLDADEMTMATVGVMQDLPNRAKRAAAVGLARAEVSLAGAQIALAERDTRLGAALAWIDLYYAQKRLVALDQVIASLAPLWQAEPSAVTSGAVRPGQALSPIRQRAMLEDRRSELQAALGRARAALTRWTGDPAPSLIGDPPQVQIDVDALRAGLDRNPTLATFAAAAQRAQANLDAARAERRSDWSVEGSYGHRDPAFGDMISAGVSVSLPIFSKRRTEPLVAARASEAAKVAVDRENARRALLAQLDSDLADHLMHHEQWSRSTEIVLSAAKKQADLETASYGAGRAGLSDVIEAFGVLADARLQALDREAEVARDAVRINLTYGG